MDKRKETGERNKTSHTTVNIVIIITDTKFSTIVCVVYLVCCRVDQIVIGIEIEFEFDTEQCVLLTIKRKNIIVLPMSISY